MKPSILSCRLSSARRLAWLAVGAIAWSAPARPADERPPRLRLPERFRLVVLGKPIEEVVRAYRSGDARTVSAVAGVFKAARRWSAKSDSWYLERTGRRTPLGMWTLACPLHPQRVRDFSRHNFRWSIDDPWRLVCPLCKAEGRKYYYYPNPRYPDDGRGCYPSDRVWREDHDAAWSRAHGGIPYDHWDGKPHGYSASGYAYFFLGKCSHEIMTFMARCTLPQLARGYALGIRVAGDDRARREAQRCAHKAKVALLSLARAHLGDAYLADLYDWSLDEFYERMAVFYSEDPKGLSRTRFPGYAPYDLGDGVVGDPKHPARRRADRYGDGSYRGDLYARGWLTAFAFIRDSFSREEEPIRGMIERLLVSHEGDAAALADTAIDPARKVKKGKLELGFRPFEMTVGRSDNLGGRTLATKFDYGVLLDDPRIVDCVVQNVWCYLRNYFNGDGLGRETSPAYTLCAWCTLHQVLRRIYGYRGAYGPGHPWWDERLRGLNPYRDPEFKRAVCKLAFSLFPDGSLIPWMDSHVGARLGASYLNLAANEGGGLPPAYAGFFKQVRKGERVEVSPDPSRLPSVLLGESCKAILRQGQGADQAVLTLNYAPNTGHWHPAPMDLVLYACGHELAPDLGYYGAMHALTRSWIRTCPAHNTCLARDAQGRHDFMHSVQGEMRTLFLPGQVVGVVEIAERDRQHLKRIPGREPFYQRTCALVSAPGAREANHYVVDIFRVRGGVWRDYYFHSQGRAARVAGVALEALPADESLRRASGFKYPSRPRYGIDAIRRLRRGRTSGAFAVTWSRVVDYRRTPPAEVDHLGLRLTMLPAPRTEIFLGQAPGARRLSSSIDRDEPLHVLCVRRPAGPDIDAFVSVIEPFRERPFVTAVQPLRVDAVGCHAVAVQVATAAGTDCLVSLAATGEGPRSATVHLPGGEKLRTDALFVWVRFKRGRPARLLAAGGRRVDVGARGLRLAPAATGRLVDFDDERDTLTVETPSSLPVGETLADRVLIIPHEVGTTAFTIARVEPLGSQGAEAPHYRVHLKWHPHVIENYVRVKAVSARSVDVEPIVSLPFDFEQRRYQLYKVGARGETTWVGEVVRRRGLYRLQLDRLRVTLRHGDLVGLTRLRKGRDRFVCIQSVEWRLQ